MARRRCYPGIIVLLSFLILCGCDHLPFGKKIVLSGRGKTIASYKCLRFKSQLKELNKKRLVLMEAEKYALFQQETGRGDRGVKLSKDLREKNYAQVESNLIDCLCHETREDKDARKIWQFEHTMKFNPPGSQPAPAGVTP